MRANSRAAPSSNPWSALRSPSPQGGEGFSFSLSPWGERAGVRGSRPHAERRRNRAGSKAQQAGAIHLHIERLALHGIIPANAPRLTAALEAELTALAAQLTQFPPFAADTVPHARIAVGGTPEHTGRAIANSVWSSIAAGAPQ